MNLFKLATISRSKPPLDLFIVVNTDNKFVCPLRLTTAQCAGTYCGMRHWRYPRLVPEMHSPPQWPLVSGQLISYDFVYYNVKRFDWHIVTFFLHKVPTNERSIHSFILRRRWRHSFCFHVLCTGWYNWRHCYRLLCVFVPYWGNFEGIHKNVGFTYTSSLNTWKGPSPTLFNCNEGKIHI